MAKECRLEGQDWQRPRQVSLTQSHQQTIGAVEKAISTVRGLARTYVAVLKEKRVFRGPSDTLRGFS